ncbi:MAG: hypothetical protein H6642_12680 [Caldilineaceae bacterium]|nr:hypothetical protein [Caldilineaceae bacterium]
MPLYRNRLPATQRRAAGALFGLIIMSLVGCGRQPPRTNPALVDLAVRATVYAVPTATPRVIEVTRIVEVTRVVEVTRLVETTPTPLPTATPTITPEPTPVAQIDAAAVALAAEAAPAPAAEAPPVTAERQSEPAEAICPPVSDRAYTLIPVDGGGAAHPPAEHGDLNLALRGYTSVSAELAIININGPTDGDPPQLADIFADRRMPAFAGTYRVYDWNWSCGAHGCRGDALDQREVTLLGLAGQAGEEIRIPSRNAQIYGGDFKALVLYADERRITLAYTREDSVANGYTVHLEQICVDPNLLALYRQATAEGRSSLPALHNGEPLGTALGEVVVAIRDRGVFFDPRARKDWWRGF